MQPGTQETNQLLQFITEKRPLYDKAEKPKWWACILTLYSDFNNKSKNKLRNLNNNDYDNKLTRSENKNRKILFLHVIPKLAGPMQGVKKLWSAL